MNGNIYHFRYPQFLWSRDIYSILKSIDNLQERTIVDAPCGSGIVTYWLRKKLPDIRFELYDLSKDCIEIARRYIPGVTIEYEDIFEVDSSGCTGDVWLLINSLYCLPEIDRLVNRHASRMQYIIGIFPDINHRNYRCFFKKNPSFNNYSEMDQAQTVNFFKKHDYDLLYSKSVTHIPYRCYSFTGQSRYFNLLDSFFRKKNSGAYWICLFKRA